jgi:intergrase/recombinase
MLEEFEEFMRVNMRLEVRTALDTREHIVRYLAHAHNIVSYETASSFLKTYLTKAPKTYNSQITYLRRFIRDFLQAPECIVKFKMAPVDYSNKTFNLPTKEQMKLAFEALPTEEMKALFLFTATSGLRKSEILDLAKDKVDFKTRAVIPQHFTRVKRSGITFYSDETEIWLNKMLALRPSEGQTLFSISERQCKKLWRTATKASKVKITPQVLRVWFSMEMGEQGIPDRFVDIFQGRAPRSVLAKHYTAKGIERLKTIYEKANLKVVG